MKSAMCLQFFKERKFYASRASKVKLVLKLLALDAAKKGWLKNMRHFHVGGQHLVLDVLRHQEKVSLLLCHWTWCGEGDVV